MPIPETPQMIPQSVPPLDDRGGDKTLPSLVKEVWWRFLNDLTNLAGAVRTEVLRLISRKINTTAPLTGGGDLSADLTLGIVDFVGDSGSGGARGTVPAPASGSAAANKFLGAGGAFIVVPNVVGDSGSGGTAGLVPAPPAGSAAAGAFLSANGTFRIPSGTGVPFVAPPLVASLTWMNQSTSTAIDASNGIFFTQPFGATQYIAALVQNAPGTPWTFTMAFLPLMFAVNFQSCGLAISDGTKITTLRLACNSGVLSLQIDDWTNATTYSGSLSSGANFVAVYYPLWFRVNDNGTNVIWSYSIDGVNFLQILSRARTTFQTPSKFGICSNAQNGSQNVYFTCLSWGIT